MTCDQAREWLSAVLDDALGAEERREVEAHLAGCADCRRELEQLRRTLALVRTLGPARAPAGFVDRVLAAARPEPRVRRVLRRLFQPLRWKLPLEATAVLLVAVTALYVYRQSSELQEAARLDAPLASRPATPASPAAPPAAVPPAAPASRPVSPEPAPPGPPAGGKEAKQEESRRLATAKEGTPAGGGRRPDAVARDEASPPAPLAAAPRAPEVGGSGVFRGAAAPSTEDASKRAPAAQPEADPGREAAKPSAGAPSAASAPSERSTARDRAEQAKTSLAPTPPPDVTGRLAVPDRQAALRALAALARELGATHTPGSPAPGRQAAEHVDLVVPRDAYPALVAGLARIGEWRADREPVELAGQVHLTIRLVD